VISALQSIVPLQALFKARSSPFINKDVSGFKGTALRFHRDIAFPLMSLRVHIQDPSDIDDL